MAEGEKEKKSSSSNNEESVKLFVGQVPKHMTEDELLAMFKEFALVDEVNIIKDKTTRVSRGCILALNSSHSRFAVCNGSCNPNFLFS
jgi:CUG-BP- and ETR3-like factor